MPARLTTETFIEKARLIHTDRYLYENTVYTGSHNIVTVTCKRHGDFQVKAYLHLRGNHCPLCVRDNKRMTRQDFIQRCIKMYPTVSFSGFPQEYIGIDEVIELNCMEHGSFKTTKRKMLKGTGCPKCVKKSCEVGSTILGGLYAS